MEEFAQAVSRELHDNIAQTVAAALNKMELGAHYYEAGDATAALAKWDAARTIARQALVTTKTLAVQARSYFAADVPATRRSVENSTRLPHRDLPQEEIFLILKEAVNNALTHSGADNITITLSVDQGTVAATVADDGSGVPGDRFGSPESLGLRSMQERVQLLGGTVGVTSQQAAGTQVQVDIPLPAQPRRG